MIKILLGPQIGTQFAPGNLPARPFFDFDGQVRPRFCPVDDRVEIDGMATNVLGCLLVIYPNLIEVFFNFHTGIMDKS